MTLAVIIAHLFFLGLLFHYQKQDKLYIGYTTVLCLLFGGLIVLCLFDGLLSENSSNSVLLLSLWIMGSVLIYALSQLTLAFEKITKLSRAIAMMNLENQKDELNVAQSVTQESLED